MMACRSTGARGLGACRDSLVSRRTRSARRFPSPDRLQGHAGTFGEGASTVHCDTLQVLRGLVRQKPRTGFI